MLPKIFCITLKNTPKRREHAAKYFENHNLDVEFFEGIHGETFGLKSTIPCNQDHNYNNTDNYYIGNGRVGCFLSHYMLWKTLSYLPYDEILILEDDCLLCDDFVTKFNYYKSQLPEDWQYVFVGHCCLSDDNQKITINENIITTVIPPLCTHAYLIKKSSIPILLDTNDRVWTAIDIQIQLKSLKQLKHYIFMPQLVNQMSLLKQLIPNTDLDKDNIFNSLINNQ